MGGTGSAGKGQVSKYHQTGAHLPPEAFAWTHFNLWNLATIVSFGGQRKFGPAFS